MGTQSVRSGVRARRAPSHIVATEDSPAAPVADTEMPAHAFRLGLYTDLSNPKALVFFGAANVCGKGADAKTVWFLVVTFIVRGFSTWLAKYSPLIDVLAGVIFIILGAVMVYEGIVHLL